MLYNYNIGDVLMTTRYDPPPLVIMFPGIIVSSDQLTYGLSLDNNHVTTQWTQGSDTDCAQLQAGNCFKLNEPHYTPGSVVTAPHHSSVLSALVRILIGKWTREKNAGYIPTGEPENIVIWDATQSEDCFYPEPLTGWRIISSHPLIRCFLEVEAWRRLFS